jgi:hypothetical protein
VDTPITVATAKSLQDFIKSKKNINTVKKTDQCTARFVKWLAETQNERRDLIQIPAASMDVYVGAFLMAIKKESGDDYEPTTLVSFHRGIARRLTELQYGYDIVKDPQFQTSNKVLGAMKRQLKQLGKGNRPNKADPLSAQDEERLWQTGQLGLNTPESLYNTVWYYNTKLFGFRGSHESRQLLWGDIQLKKDESGEYLIFNERETKTRTGNTTHLRPFAPKIFATYNEDRCPILAYKKFADNRPDSMLEDNAPFYLAVNYKPKKDNIWFKAQAMGVERLQKTMTRMADKAGLSGRFTNHSVRKTMCSQLLHAEVPPSTIVQLSGHKNIQSLNLYATASKDQQRDMSNILLGQKRHFGDTTHTLPSTSSHPSIVPGPTTNDEQQLTKYPRITASAPMSVSVPVPNTVAAPAPAPMSLSGSTTSMESRSQNLVSGMFAGAVFHGAVNISFSK